MVEQLSAAANIFLGRERRNRLGLLDDRGMERAAAALSEQLECHDLAVPAGRLAARRRSAVDRNRQSAVARGRDSDHG